MSLLNGARELATRSRQRCVLLHVFQAALPQASNLQASYPQPSYLDEPTKSSWENLVAFQTRELWAREIQQEIARLPLVSQQGMVGMESDEFRALESEARSKANQMSRPLDAVVLAMVIEREPLIQRVMQNTREDYRSLIQRLDSQPLSSPPSFPTMPPAQSPEDRERELAIRALDDFLKIVPPSKDVRYARLQTIETDAFLATLAQASTNSATLVCVGQEGTSINVVDHIIADRLASKSFPDEELRQYTGKLFKLDFSELLIQMELPNTPRPASVLRAAKYKLAGMAERSILLLDHIEALGDTGGSRDADDIEELESEIAAHGQVLAFGIFHAPDSTNDYLRAARLGHPTVRAMPFKPYTAAETRALIERFYLPLWKKEGRGFIFAKDPFDLLIRLEPGAWHDQTHKVLPGVVIAITQDAMRTALDGGEAEIRETVSRARDAIAKIRSDEMRQPNSRTKFESLLKQAEDEVTALISPRRRLFGMTAGPAPVVQDPARPILITGAHIVAELICPNRSEFHVPGFVPDAVRDKVGAPVAT